MNQATSVNGRFAAGIGRLTSTPPTGSGQVLTLSSRDASQVSRDTSQINFSKLAADCGNRQIKYGFNYQHIEVMPSVIKTPHPRDRIKLSPGSRLVRYIDGQCSPLRGQQWVVGRTAVSMCGSPTFKGEKADIMPKLALACLPSVGDDLISPAAVAIGSLRLCLPDADDADKQSRIKQQLEGQHHLQIDDREMKVSIANVSVELEGLDAYKYLNASGFYQYLATNGILDFGGGNVTGQLFNEDDMPLIESRVTAPGICSLASAITRDPILMGVEPKGCTPIPEKVLDAIADGSFAYGTTGRSFAEIFQAYLQTWITELQTILRTEWQPYLNNLGEVAIIGGGANLGQHFVELTEGRFKVASDPTVCTVRGMLT